MNSQLTTEVPISANQFPVWALSPIGPHANAPAQLVDNTKVWTFPVPQGTLVRISCAQNLYVRTRLATDPAPADAAHLQQTGFLKAGAIWVTRSLGAIDVCSDVSAAVSWAPDVLIGTENG